MRMMGADSVHYHRATVLERGDDHQGAALAYFASRGETPLVWGGSGAARLGLSGNVDTAEFEAVFGPGGACDPASGRRLVRTSRPGMELVVAAHKSVAVLGVVGRAEHMHEIMDAERDATLAYLEARTRERGGRRGRAMVPVATSGMTWAVTRHATSRSGDPAPHDHVLIANVVEMGDERGGWKAPDTILWRDHLRAATAVGRMAGARRAVELGYAIEPDDGPSGRLGHWRIVGVPVEVERLFSKRSEEMTAAVAERGVDGPRARAVAARATRSGKRFTPVGDLMARWHGELAGLDRTPDGLLRDVVEAGRRVPAPSRQPSPAQVDALVGSLLAVDGRLGERKVFTRADVVVAAAPWLFGRAPSQLDRLVDRVLASRDTIPLLEPARRGEPRYTSAPVLAVETAIAQLAVTGARTREAARVSAGLVDEVLVRADAERGHALNAGQAAAVRAVATSGRRVEVVVGVAGSGKTTALGVVRQAFEAAGREVLGTSTSGQAARTLGREAGLGESRTVASLVWRLERGAQRLHAGQVLIVDEAGMTNDVDLLKLLAATRRSGTKVILVGDDRQLGAVGPGGGLAGLVARVPQAVHVLAENVRQHDPAERAALGELRAGDPARAVAW